MQQDDAIISIDPNQEDEQVPAQRPPKFTNKSKTDTNKKPKNTNDLDGFAGDARRKESYTNDNNNQKDSRYEKRDRELKKAGAWINNNGKNLQNVSLGDLDREDDGV